MPNAVWKADLRRGAAPRSDRGRARAARLAGLSTSWRGLPRRSTPSTASTRRAWDVHHGDGTNDIFRTSDAVPVRQHPSVRHPSRDGPLHDVSSVAGEGFSVNHRCRRAPRGRVGIAARARRRARRFGGGYARGAAGDEPPEMVPHFLTARAASNIGYCRTGGRGCATSHPTTAVRKPGVALQSPARRRGAHARRGWPHTPVRASTLLRWGRDGSGCGQRRHGNATPAVTARPWHRRRRPRWPPRPSRRRRPA
jgi:hypothetical protein